MSTPFSTGYSSPVSESYCFSASTSPATSPRNILELAAAKVASIEASVCVDSLNDTLRGVSAVLKASRKITRPLKTLRRKV
jgi:hypothetical protein